MSEGTEMKVCFNRQLTLDETAGFIAYTMIYCNSIGVDADYRAMEKHLEQESNCNKPAVSKCESIERKTSVCPTCGSECYVGGEDGETRYFIPAHS